MSTSGEPMDAESLLQRAVPALRTLPAEQLAAIATGAEVRSVAPGARITRQGEPAARVFVVVDGHAQLLGQLDRDGAHAETVITWLTAGDVVDEVSLVDGEPWSASCIAVTTTTCVAVVRTAFREALRQHWPLTEHVLEAMAARIRAANGLLAEYARDPLTGLSQLRAAAEFYERELAIARRTAHSAGGATRAIALVLVDVDGLRFVNERFGHSAGDDVLRAVARSLASVGRATDLVARIQDDEFLLLLPAAGMGGAGDVARRLRLRLRDLPESLPPFTVSVGLSLADHGVQQPLSTALEKTRDALRLDKARGASGRGASGRGA